MGMINRLIIFVVVMAAAPAVAAQSLAERLEYSRTASRAQIALAEDVQTRAHDLRVRNHGAQIILIGVVPTAAARTRAEDVVRSAVGGAAIQNQIQVAGQAPREAVPLPPRVTERPPAPRAEDRTTAEQPPPAAAPERAEREEPRQPQPVYHTVRSGDNLGALARRYGTTVREIQRLNNLRGTNIRVGQRLRVK
jgi:hypothetical protein